MWCWPADSHLKLLVSVVRCAGFLPVGVLECNLAHLRSMAVSCLVYKIKKIPMHPLTVNCLCRMCRCVLLLALWLLICTLLRLLAVELLSTIEALCPSQCFFERAEPIPVVLICSLFLSLTIFSFYIFSFSCCPKLLFLSVSYYFLSFVLPWVDCVGLGTSD